MALFQKAFIDWVQQFAGMPTKSLIPLLDDTEPESIHLTVSDESLAPTTFATSHSTVSSLVALTSATPDYELVISGTLAKHFDWLCMDCPQ